MTLAPERYHIDFGEQGESMLKTAEDASRAAELMQDAFQIASDEVLDAIRTMVEGGKVEIEDLVETILRQIARLALDDFVLDPLEAWLDRMSATLTGNRAEGGPVVPGAAYLVGERGPISISPSPAMTRRSARVAMR